MFRSCAGKGVSDGTYVPADLAAAVAKRPAGSAESVSYWPEIDGLRTLAVLSVFLFHLNNRLLSGGFVGVDVFFAISGFLITDVLLTKHNRQGREILWFYQRRIARIAPAAFVTIATSLGAAYFIFSAQDFALLGSMVAWAAISAINIKLPFQGTYFANFSDAQPLIHFWSLAVEEQFYLLFPLVLYLLIERSGRPARALWILTAASFVASVAVAPNFPSEAFYLLPTRAWELLAGSSLAVWRRDRPPLRPGRASVLLTLGTAIIVASFLLVSSEGFPGWQAAIPVLGAVLALASVGRSGGITQRFLASSPMTAIGRRSYSLYLWHWPIFSFVDYGLYQETSAVRTLLKVGLTIAATAASYALVERPFRSWLNMRRYRRLAFALFALVAAALVGGGLFIRHHYLLDASGRVATGGVAVNPTGRRGAVVIVGDSQASMYGYELASLAGPMDFRLNVLSVSGGNELPGERATHWPQVRTFLDGHRPTVVVLAQIWTEKLGEKGKSELAGAIQAFLDRADYIVLLTQPPAPPLEATREGIRAGARPPFFQNAAQARSRAQIAATLRGLAGPRVIILDVTDAYLNPDGSIRLANAKGRETFSDRYHLTDAGTALVRTRFAAVLAALLDRPRPSSR